MTLENLRECFSDALKDEKKGRKHKGLLAVKPKEKEAEEYIIKAKQNLELCKLYKEKSFDYKLPEEWFYSLYYCALAILSKFGVESRSQRCTAIFLSYIKDIEKEYDNMMGLCKKALSQCEDIVFSDQELKVPKELLE